MKKEQKQLIVGAVTFVVSFVLILMTFPHPIGFLWIPFCGIGLTMIVEPLCQMISESKFGMWMMTDDE